MLRRTCSFATAWNASASVANLVFAFGLGVTTLMGCSGKADSDGGGGRAVTGLEDASGLPSRAATDDGRPAGPGVENTGEVARTDPPNAGTDQTPHFPSGGDWLPPPTPAGGTDGGTADGSGNDLDVPRLPPGVALTRPAVVLSGARTRRFCRVRVGDVMPSFTLPDVAGQSQSLPGLLGGKLTVVVFWTLQHPYATEQFERLAAEVVGPYAEFGVNTVAVNVGDAPELVQAAGQRIDAAFPVLLDEESSVLDLVATGKLPRTYLLDPAGRILWFDIEYSESTRRELNNAILWHLIKEPIVATR